MKQDGMTLIEILAVLVITGILLVVGGFEFANWRARYNVESQIKTMHMDLMTARQRAMQKNTQHVAQVPAVKGNSYLICEDSDSNNQCDAPGETTQSSISNTLSKNSLVYPVSSDVDGVLVMNTRGVLMISKSGINTNVSSNKIWLTDPNTGVYYDSTKVDYDCISLTATRIDTGKYDGTTCNAK
jgi:prepilin-type N-terminal cleavage/methylation domain-containing protein